MEPPMLDREVRLGIVLYGGVSLAVYENGVAQELFRAVKGDGVYSFVKQLIDSDIVVDILSGTSAGGINGIMLGYALANGRDFRSSAALWLKDGDILHLLQKPNDAGADSLLDGGGYYQRGLQESFDGMPAYFAPEGDGVAKERRIVSPVEELDLFVTSTDVEGRVFTTFDDQGHAIDVKDHRQVFQLCYRRDRKNDFESGQSAALAKLARSTSCFPVAFGPVEMQRLDAGDEPLRRWGQFDDRDRIYFLDGGVLDNKPFSYTISAITRRMADRDVERLLLYVEPDPERFQGEAPVRKPNVVAAGLDALIGIPGYQSIADDLRAIAANNDRVQRYSEISNCLPASKDAPERGPDDVMSIVDADRRCVYETARLGMLRDQAIEGILKTSGFLTLLRDEPARRAAKILMDSFRAWKVVPEDAAALAKFDVYFRLRRLLHMSSFLKARMCEQPGGEKAGEYRALRRRLNHQFQVLEQIGFAMKSAIGEARIPWRDLSGEQANAKHAAAKWAMVANILAAVLDTAGVTLGAAVCEGIGGEDAARRQERELLMEALRNRIDAAPSADPAIKPPVEGNLLAECDRIECELFQNFAPAQARAPIWREYCRFLAMDSILFPMQRMAGIESTDAIRTVRISPIDAQRAYSAETLNAKLCGNELGHFGGFLKRSWRANDIMWGRLDALCQLVECLITPERMRDVRPDSVQAAFDYDLTRLFPHSPEKCAEIQRLAAGLARGGWASKEDFAQFREALIAAAQAEILSEEVPRVIQAAIDQQADWNQFEVQKPKRGLMGEKLVWSVSPRRLDAALAGYAAEKLAEEAEPAGGWPKYFETTYAVGSESWSEDIPKPVLVEILGHASLVLRNCLLAAAGPRGDKIRTSTVFRFLINFPLVALYRFVRLQRMAPEYVRTTIAVVLAACVELLVIDYLFRAAIFGASQSWTKWLWLGGPALGIVATLGFLYLFRRPVRPAASSGKPKRG